MSDTWIAPFLAALRIDGNVSRAARAAGIDSTVAYVRRKTDADLAEAWRIAHEDAGDNLIAEARRRAVDGVNEPVIYQGQPTPMFERDNNGEVVLYQTGVDLTGKPIMHPRQARDADGALVWLTVNKRSDALLTLLLKGYKKQLFAERTELTGADGAPVEIDATTRRARIAAIMAGAQARKAFGDIA